MPDIYFYEAFREEREALMARLPNHIDADYTWQNIQETDHTIPPARIISIRTQSEIPREWAGQLDAILTRSAGYDHVKIYLQTVKTHIPTGYLPEYCVRAVAEQAAMLWMALLRKLPQQQKQFETFLRDDITGRENTGKTLLVVGVGHIGHEIITIGKALGMQVKGVDIVQRHADVDYVDISSGLKAADIIVSAMNLTADNVDYFNEKLLRKCEPGVIFVNIARGELSPPADLLALLDEGRLGGIALDVYPNEPRIATMLRNGNGADDGVITTLRELNQRNNVILTPHNAFNTEEAVERKAQQSVEQIVEFMRDGRFLWPIPQ